VNDAEAGAIGRGAATLTEPSSPASPGAVVDPWDEAPHPLPSAAITATRTRGTRARAMEAWRIGVDSDGDYV
jgi:hypothetical protein